MIPQILKLFILFPKSTFQTLKNQTWLISNFHLKSWLLRILRANVKNVNKQRWILSWKKSKKMQSVRTAFVSLQKSLLQPTKNVVSINSQRTYVRNFWEENNDYKGIPGHTRNPPKMFGYTRSKRNVSSHVLHTVRNLHFLSKN